MLFLIATHPHIGNRQKHVSSISVPEWGILIPLSLTALQHKFFSSFVEQKLCELYFSPKSM